MITNLVKDFRCEVNGKNYLTVNLSDNYLVGKKVILKTSVVSEFVVLGSDQLNYLIQFLQQCKTEIESKN